MKIRHRPSAAPAVWSLAAGMRRATRRRWLCMLLGAACWSLSSPGWAALDLADMPVPVAMNASKVQPNIMFTLDDSGSMQFEVMPEEEILSNAYYLFPYVPGIYGGSDYTRRVVGFDHNLTVARLRSSHVNKIYYDPAVRYRPWSRHDGSEWPQANPAQAWHNPARTAKGGRNLTKENTESAYWLNDGGNGVGSREQSRSFHPALHYRYKGGNARQLGSYERVEILPKNAPFAGGPQRSDCRDSMACSYAEEIQNFANWYSYYRSRILASHAGIGKAFSRLDQKVRVGFGTINQGKKTIDGKSSPGTIILGVKQFAGDYRQDWFDTVYGHVIPNAGTPLRRALDDVGQYFMREDDKGPWGPAPMYACRQSYNILMTDGYWTNDSSSAARTSAARQNVDNSKGPVINLPMRYQYEPAPPYQDTYANTLADVAMYYWQRDLHSGLDNLVPTNSSDPAYWQHLVNFTVGLGVSSSGRKKDDPWPNPTAAEVNKIDDLEHAAVNSRGAFFNASDPEEFADQLVQALNDIAGRNNTFAANAISNPNVSTLDNVTYGTSYNPADWSGEVSAYALDPVTGAIGSTSLWQPGAKTRLNARTQHDSDSRLIATFGNGRGIPFQWGSLSAAQQGKLAHEGTSGQAVLRFLRGQRAGEGETLRKRQSILGDIVHAEGVVVGAAAYHYSDPGYAAFAASMAARPKTLYQGANDGMLHAFDAGLGPAGGEERWAYVPGMLLEKLPQLSRKVGFSHVYYVDGSPVQADVDFAWTEGGAGFPGAGATEARPTDWRTLLVGGLGKGGSGYYALDVTQPAARDEAAVAAKVLWEFTDPDMGYSYGRPVIAKTRAKGWVVLLTSGYNNVPASKGGAPGRNSGDGKGYLYVLNPRNGELIKKLALPLEAARPDNAYLDQPLGFAQISGFVDNSDTDNTLDLVYGGDLQGGLWRFDLSGDTTDSWSVSRFASLTDPQGQPQPLTAAPETGYIREAYAKRRMVYVGTGKYLGISDVQDVQVQSLYGLKDEGILARDNEVQGAQVALPAATLNARDGKLVQQTLLMEPGSNTRTASHHAVDLRSKDGWLIDWPLSGERADTDPQLAYGVLAVTTNVPDDSPCSIYGGSSWINFFDYRTGGVIRLASGSHATAGRLLGNTLASRPAVIVAGGQPYVTGSKSDDSRFREDLPPPSVSKRVAWRELTEE